MAKDDDNPQQPGPDPERVKIDGDWEDAIKQAMGKPKPENGWPDPEDSTSGPGDDDARVED
ncbi:MAG: hypothetical protein AAF916_00110 [Planctomycetota bacterium]